VTLAYRLTNSSIEKTGLDAITLSLSGRNLWLWTEDKTLGQDPETNLTGRMVEDYSILTVQTQNHLFSH
jgi:hypothetical protein